MNKIQKQEITENQAHKHTYRSTAIDTDIIAYVHFKTNRLQLHFSK